MFDSFFREFPWRRFQEFTSLDTDRFALLRELIKEASLESTILEIAGCRHIIIAPPPPGEEFLRRVPVILVAHYDRSEGSPGANDNSAGVFLLLETAMKLKKAGERNWIIIFTDKEELKTGEKLEDQGSYNLAAGLRDLKLENSKIFSFDACGIGDTLVISTTLEYLVKREGGGEKMRESMLELRNLALNTARNLGMLKVLLAPTPFSDDAGFFRAGIAAQTITTLPSEECIPLVSELRKNPAFANTLITTEWQQNSHVQSIPETWRYLNSRSDSYLRLTPQNFRAVIRFAEALCKG